MEVVCAEGFCYIERGHFGEDWRIYTKVGVSGNVLITYHVPGLLSDDLIKYKQKIAEYLSSHFKGVRYHDFDNLHTYGTTFETDADSTAVDMKALVAEVDAEVVDIMKPLWEKYEHKTLYYTKDCRTKEYGKPNMKTLL